MIDRNYEDNNGMQQRLLVIRKHNNMAAAIVSLVSNKLASFITCYVTEDSQLQKHLSCIDNELKLISAFLRDSEDRTEYSSQVMKAWVKQVIDIAHQIENVIDEHAYTSVLDQPQNPFSTILRTSVTRIKEELLKLEQRKALYDVIKAEQSVHLIDTSSVDPIAGFAFTEDSDLVGIEKSKNEIIELLDLEAKDERCSVISILGMGGIGKTSLARKVYDSVEVKRYLNVRCWVNVNQSYDRIKLLRILIQQFYKVAQQSAAPQFEDANEISLIGELREYLQDKRYMVVFDDVWDAGLWNLVKGALPDNNKGSKILLTTRNENVALTWRASYANHNIHRIKLLAPDKSWELFCKKAFQGYSSGLCPHWLEEVSRNIVDRCEGLPLAIVSIGGLLSTKDKSYSEWKNFRDSLYSDLEQNPMLSNISRILLLSYNNLPHFLKPCLLYFAMFPEGSSVDQNRLFKLWTAEDFIKGKRHMEIEDVAKDYLYQLIHRSLVQVSVRYDCGRIRTLRVHDLVHEVLRPKLEDLSFCQILEKENPAVHKETRRISVHEGQLDDALSSINNKSGIRSVLLFGAQEVSIKILSSSQLKRVYLLKTLDLQSARLEHIPEEIGDLVLLQFLSLRFTKVKNLPKSVGKLQKLLTLDLKRCPVIELPVEIGNLRKLRHFIVYQNTWHNTLKVWVVGAVTIPGGALERLKNLQKLADINVASSNGFLHHLFEFTLLKYLAISNVKKDDSEVLCKAIEKLHCLESLNITVDFDTTDPIDLQHITSPPLPLQRLYLIGPLKEFPEWIGRLENLKKLRFRGSKLQVIPFDILQELPNLTMLGINKDVYYGDRLVFHAGGFKSLRAMYFDSLLNLNSVEIQPGSLPLLEDLLIHRSPQLKEAPLGFQYLEKLTSLKLVEMPESFVDSLGSVPHFVKQVADIRVGYQTPTGVYIYKKL